MTYRLMNGDCIEVMRNAKADSVHAVICDPPYGLSFMGKTWDSPAEMVGMSTGLSGGFQKFPDGVKRPEMKRTDSQLFQQWCEAWAIEAMRVLKPGGHLLAFGGTRMYHRLAAGIEDAGFEVRDCIMWLYGSGFPKSHNIGVNIDKMMGHNRERVPNSGGIPPGSNTFIRDHQNPAPDAETKNSSEPVSDEARAWNGWGTALKPAVEPIIVARKPLSIPGKRPGTTKKATVAQNILEHGTGAYNIDATRIGYADDSDLAAAAAAAAKNPGRDDTFSSGVYGAGRPQQSIDEAGRWPANVIMDDEAGAMLGAESRFFYCPKASRSERDAGLDAMPMVERDFGGNGVVGQGFNQSVHGKAPSARNTHTTVKPIELMRYLVRLVAAPGSVVLDPFAGSGTTGIAALLEGCKFVGIEQDAEYVAIAQARLEHWSQVNDNAGVTA